VDDWPLAFEGRRLIGAIHPDREKRWKYDPGEKPDPIETVIAAEALTHRYALLMGILRNGEMEAEGLPAAPEHPRKILRSIWSHNDFSFDATRGDVLQFNDESQGRGDRLIRRWIGVLLQRAIAADSERTSDLRGSSIPTAAQTTDGVLYTSDDRPFTIADVLAIGSLSDALTRMVFNHSEVRALLAKATAVVGRKGPFEEHAGLVGLVYGHDEPLLPLRYFQSNWDEVPSDSLPVARWEEEDPGVAEYFERKGPPEIDAYYDAVNLRAYALIGMLQSQQVMAFGHSIDGHLIRIAHSIWSHEDYYVHPPTGDIYEAGYGSMTKKWTGVILEAPSTTPPAALFHVKPPTFDVIPPATAEPPRAHKTPSKAIARVETTGVSYKACVAWLVEIMRASPNERTESIESLSQKARQRWPGTLSHRSFLDARADAIRATGANAWAAAGAPKKSPR
jgi:hypothetical protein